MRGDVAGCEEFGGGGLGVQGGEDVLSGGLVVGVGRVEERDAGCLE